MEKPSKRNTEMEHRREQAKKDRLMKATAQAQISSHRYSDDLKFSILPMKGNDTFLSSSIKHVLPNYHSFVKALNSTKHYNPFLGLDETDPATTHVQVASCVLKPPIKKKEKKVTPTKDEQIPSKPRPPDIKLPKSCEDKKASRTSSVISILKEMTQVDPPLTPFKKEKSVSKKSEFVYPTTYSEKGTTNKDKQKATKKSPPSVTKKGKKKSPLKVVGTRLSADDQQVLSTDKHVLKRSESVSHIINQMDLGTKKGTASSSSSSDDSSSGSSSSSSDSESEATTNKPNDTKEEPPDKATPFLHNNDNNNSIFLDKTEINTSKSNVCGVSNDSNESLFGLKFPSEKTSINLSSVAVDENSGSFLDGKGIEHIMGIEPYNLGKPTSPISPLDIASTLFEEIIPCQDQSLENDNFTGVDLLGTINCKETSKDFTDSSNFEKKTAFNSFSTEDNPPSSHLLHKKGSGTLYQKDSKKDSKPERRNSVKSKDSTQNNKTDERNKKSSKSNETKDKSKSKNTRIDSPVNSNVNGKQSVKFKTKAELKMPVSNLNVPEKKNQDNSDIESKSRSKTSRQKPEKQDKKNSKLNEIDNDSKHNVSISESTTIASTSTTLSNSTLSLKRPSPTTLNFNDGNVSKKPTMESNKMTIPTDSILLQDIKTEPFSMFGSNDSGFNEGSDNKEANSILNDLNKLINEPEEPSLDINRLLGSNNIFQNGPSSGIRSIISPLKSPEHLKFDIPYIQSRTEEPPQGVANSTSFLMETTSQTIIPTLQQPPLVVSSLQQKNSASLNAPSAMLTRTTNIIAPPFSQVSSMIPSEPRSVNDSNHLLTSAVTSLITCATMNGNIQRKNDGIPPQQLNNSTCLNNFMGHPTVTFDTQLNHQNSSQSNVLNVSAPALNQSNVLNVNLPTLNQSNVLNASTPAFNKSNVLNVNVNVPALSQSNVLNINVPALNRSNVQNVNEPKLNQSNNLNVNGPTALHFDNIQSKQFTQLNNSELNFTNHTLTDQSPPANAPPLNFMNVNEMNNTTLISTKPASNVITQPPIFMNGLTHEINFQQPVAISQTMLPVNSVSANIPPLDIRNSFPKSSISTLPANNNSVDDISLPTLSFSNSEFLEDRQPIPDQKPSFAGLEEKPMESMPTVHVTAEMPYVSPKEEDMDIAEDKLEPPPEQRPQLPPPPPLPPLSSERVIIKEEPEDPPEKPQSSVPVGVKEEETPSPGNCFDVIKQFDQSLMKDKPGSLIVRIPLNLIKLKDSTISDYKNRTRMLKVVDKSPNGEDMEIDVLGDDSPLKRKLPATYGQGGVKKIARIDSSTEESDRETVNVEPLREEEVASNLIVRIPLSKLKRIPQKNAKNRVKEEPIESATGSEINGARPEVVCTVVKKKRGRKPKEKTIPAPTPVIKLEENNTDPNSCSSCGTLINDNSRNPQRLACYKNTYTTYLKSGRSNKHRADCLTDEIDKAHMYIEAVLNYAEYLVGLEQSAGKMSTTEGVGEFMKVTSECMKLVEYVMNNYSRKIDPVLNAWDKRFLFLCCRLQSAFNLKLYKMKKESVKKNSKILSQYYKQYKTNSIIGRSPYTKPNQRGTGTPSPSSPSPGPSPGGSVASVGSAGSIGSTGVNEKSGPNMVSIPVDMHEKGFNFMQSTKFLINAHRLWDDSENLQNHIQGFVQALTKKAGVFTMQSTLLHTVDYIRAGIHIIQESRKPS